MSVGLYLQLTAVGAVITVALSYQFILKPRLKKLYSSSNPDEKR